MLSVNLDVDEDIFRSSKIRNPHNLLWRAVIAQAFIDAKSKNKDRKYKYYRNKAVKWLDINNEDFLEVCVLAGLEPQFVLSKFEEYQINSSL